MATRLALSIGAVAVIAGCGVLRQAQDDMSPVGMPAAPGAVALTSTSYNVLLAFGSAPRRLSRGRRPVAGLVDVNGTLYGTTEAGGGFDDGTVFSINAEGKEKILYRFRGGSDGAHPNADLINVNGTLYGTTEFGGSLGCWNQNGCGTVFSVTTTGAEKVLHSFTGGCKSCPDGALPTGSLINVNGTLYGTTNGGGGLYTTAYYCCGTFYRISLTGKEKVLFRFASHDGLYPNGSLVDEDGTLYGTTYSGGKSDRGTVFSMSTTGKEKVLYSFGGGSDGEYPYAGLTNVNGTLYGTTSGASSTSYSNSGCKPGCGTVFGISLSGTEKVLHNFTGGSDGASPYAGLANVNGTLYGTTQFGGGGECQSKYGSGCGTIYEITTAGSETVLHSFGGGSDGADPLADLIDVSGALYGTTARGGTSDCGGEGCGTVFELTP
jgi:uncharacterized repeat protein (TIGR03803 family)